MVLGYACSKYTKGLLSQPETLQLVDCFFRLLCKKEQNVKHIVLKVIPLTTPALAFLKEKYPKIKLVFNTRHPRSTTISFRKLEQRLITFSSALSGLWTLASRGKAHQFLLSLPSFDSLDWWQAMRRDLSRIKVSDPWPQQKALMVVYYFYAPILAFLANREQYCHLVLYEDLADNPTSVVKDLLNALNHPAEHLSHAIEALKKDSQAGMFGGRGSSREDQAEALEEVEKLFQRFNAPLSVNMTEEAWRNFFLK